MTQQEYKIIENYMLEMMKDSCHDSHHIYRVLNAALDISQYEKNINMDVLIAVCLLHDIGREAQSKDLTLCHAQIGSKMAYEFLLNLGWEEKKARHVKECISTHRFRVDNPPKSLEAKILFDSDKLDVCGAVGIARTLIYAGQVGEPLYHLDEEKNIVTEGGGAEISSFFQEYNYKSRKLYNAFYTYRARELAESRKKASESYYTYLREEVVQNYEGKDDLLKSILKE